MSLQQFAFLFVLLVLVIFVSRFVLVLVMCSVCTATSLLPVMPVLMFMFVLVVPFIFHRFLLCLHLCTLMYSVTIATGFHASRYLRRQRRRCLMGNVRSGRPRGAGLRSPGVVWCVCVCGVCV